MFLACPAEMLPTLQLKTGSDQVRSVMFTTGLFAFKSGLFVLTAYHVVDSWYFTKTGSTTRQFLGGQSHSLDTESWRVGEI